MSDWKETSYDKTYNATLKSLQRRRNDDETFGLDEATRMLKDLYVQDGNDWGGRGELQDVVMQATIDAFECFIGTW